ncbi:MAG: COX15/CtaA family protein [Candidatus Thermoplasmatota archaeon]|nr:COX15/CtaA family protein [Candidatus Thermoplasmatota archaeon]
MLEKIDTKRLTAGLIVLTFLVIAVGGLVRVSDAGESCPDWPTCFGTWGFEVSPEEQETWWNENPDEIDSRGEHHRYTTFEIFTEWFHRLLAGVILGPLVILNWLAIRRKEEASSTTKFGSSLALVLIIWQGALGWLTVKIDNEQWSVALHLSSALAFILSLIWLWLCLNRDEGVKPSWFDFDPILASQWRNRIAWLGLGTFSSVFIGVFVATTPGADNACGVGDVDSWPLCNGQFFPEIVDLENQSQIIHRWVVAIVEITLLVAAWFVWKEQTQHQHGIVLRNWIWAATGFFILNMLIGALYILSWSPDSETFREMLSLIHLLVGSTSFLTLATAWLAISTFALHEPTPEAL